MSAWKNSLVVLIVIFLAVTFLIFLVTGYTALYWAWTRGNLGLALPYLPWARNFGILAMAGAAVALGISVLIKDVPGSTQDPPFAFTACHGHDRLFF